MTDWTAAVDVGTSAVKAVLLDARGRIRASGQAEVPSADGEQEPEDWWEATIDALGQCGEGVGKVRLLALTGQMQDLVCVGGDRPLRPAILYSDTRAHSELAKAHRLLGPKWTDVTRNEQDASSLPAKVLWLRKHEPDVLDRSELVLFGASGYIGWRLTGVGCCDVTTASTTGLLDAATRTWWPTAVNALGLRDVLPPLVDGETVIGTATPPAAREAGLLPGIPVVVAPGDAVSTTIGIVGDDPDRGYIYLGTSGWLAVVVPEARVPTAAHRLLLPTLGRQLMIGAVLSAGVAADWARRTFLPGMSADDADRLAAEAGPSRLLALPSLRGERFPVRDPLARGVVVGMTDTTRPDQLYRAVLEGVAFAFRSLLDTMPDNSVPIPITGGGARSALWQRILADVLGRPVLRTNTSEGVAALGAAATAIRATGGHAPPPLADRSASTMLRPGPASTQYAKLAPAHAALLSTLTPTFQALQEKP
ncbi:MAG TPA: FGGY family carbohydrate kinase [Pseudonocardiaceae bacterium]|nr:FGGY family carbohydrate kinase [Pseudonocardiaceae bacterium]